jgi:hypothetical protein
MGQVRFGIILRKYEVTVENWGDRFGVGFDTVDEDSRNDYKRIKGLSWTTWIACKRFGGAGKPCYKRTWTVYSMWPE